MDGRALCAVLCLVLAPQVLAAPARAEPHVAQGRDPERDASLAASPVAEPVRLDFRGLAPTEVELLDAGGTALPFQMRGFDGRVELPPSLCLDVDCAPYVVQTTAPLVVDARAARVPLRAAQVGSISANFRVERGAALRHAMHDGAGHCRAQLALGADETRHPPPLVYDVELDCAGIELGAPLVHARATPPRDFRRYLVSAAATPLTLRGMRGEQWRIVPLGARSTCDEPAVHGRRKGSRFEIMMLGAGHWIRGDVPLDEVRAYTPVHIMPSCSKPRGGASSTTRGSDTGRPVVIEVGAVLRASDFDGAIAKVTKPLRAIVERRARSFEIVRWTAGIDYLCRASTHGVACVPGLFVREADLHDETADPAR